MRRRPTTRSGPGPGRTARAVCAAAALALLAGCGGGAGGGTDRAGAADSRRTGPAHPSPSATEFRRIPGVGDRLHSRIPSASRQVVAVYGEDEDSADATVVLYTRHGDTWKRERRWPAHNGRRGWTPDHRENDRRSPVGVFTLSDAGGVLPDPGTKLPYTRSAAFAAPRHWKRAYWHDFDYVIAIDYNRVRGTPPNDPTRPLGQEKGGSIWLHMDHGSGTSGCVSLSKAAMEHLLRTLDPALHPVIVMGDRKSLAS
ncbi:MAG TPA: L,D-transpeptidase family protein [Streptomyces sp.]|uniref:L,D-transpeptidase family protein n=1 Tax=Streptomyces sp. TaxID=1931 RepID=UPI002D24822B|nr:L,D-transpeptidase family protein [Streptomyces sp.]HZG03864.1 L,D-transpeptidase family protein [Streptomyces sp.]